MVKLCDIRSPKSIKKRKRVGRGNGSGHGTTSGRGTKGQLSRSGGKSRLGFEGGQMPLQRRLPHLKGFKNTRKKVNNVINVGRLEKFKDNSVIDYDFLKKSGFIMKKSNPVKILGNGKLTKKITVKANYFSRSAITKIEKAGGKAEVI
ncbi:MAG: 50S ribosomal protein L15 [Actinobacteria bacterium RBG_13_35_12]|jgi:large subunit ribosomal protein L15|nr:MAG: 50S ribosomal protein L15 [Actinobacteria bacterium RBG_13_35_12]